MFKNWVKRKNTEEVTKELKFENKRLNSEVEKLTIELENLKEEIESVKSFNKTHIEPMMRSLNESFEENTRKIYEFESKAIERSFKDAKVDAEFRKMLLDHIYELKRKIE